MDASPDVLSGIVSVVFILSPVMIAACITAYLLIKTRMAHRERMAALQQGLNPFGYDANVISQLLMQISALRAEIAQLKGVVENGSQVTAR